MFIMAQTSNNHLTFKGIPITGTVENFAQKLGAKGFKKVFSNKDAVVFEGEFAGYSGCTIYVLKVPNRNIVYRVGVFFPKESSWARLEEEYNQFKDILTNKYGDPTLYSEKFKEGALTFNDDAKMSSLKEGNGAYWSAWKVDNGTIYMEIFTTLDENDGRILLIYFDKINCALADKATENDL